MLLHRLRRASWQLGIKGATDRPSNSRRRNTSGTNTTKRTSFLDLPAEIRNAIYEFAALNTTLSLSPVNGRRGPPPAALLLTAKQITAEYRPILLAHATIHFLASHYDFSNLQRLITELRPPDAAALGCNRTLWIVVYLAHVPTRTDRALLTAWLRSCDKNLPGRRAALQDSSLPSTAPALEFHYDFLFRAHMRPPRPPSRYANGFEMRADLLRTHARMLRAIAPLVWDDAAGKRVSEEARVVLADMEAVGWGLECQAREALMGG